MENVLDILEKISKELGLEPIKEMTKQFVECDFFITTDKEKIKLGTLNISKKTEIYEKTADEINEKYDEDENYHWIKIKEEIIKKIEELIKSSTISINIKEEDEDNLYGYFEVEEGEPVYLSDGVCLFPDGSTKNLK